MGERPAADIIRRVFFHDRLGAEPGGTRYGATKQIFTAIVYQQRDNAGWAIITLIIWWGQRVASVSRMLTWRG